MESHPQILGTGIDLVENARIAASIEKFGDRFLHRIFTEGEIAYCASMPNPVPHYAARFAAKEAVSKAFGTGIGKALGWREIEIVRAESGAPSAVLHAGGAELAVQRGVRQIFVSLTHTDAYAAASATIAG
ncbi:MAG: holo-ACP synthase [Chthoniobacteraceae bacterium]|nr:holo-ACP synthase [Chthoniobacteraceae bacterium]